MMIIVSGVVCKRSNGKAKLKLLSNIRGENITAANISPYTVMQWVLFYKISIMHIIS